ncbi:MAG: UDP-N-acetylglucosamine 4,6-dehydratase (inverting) [Ekhidna sp.]
MSFFKEKKIAILGGSGTLGRALVQALTKNGVSRILVFSRDEIKQLEMMETFPAEEFPMIDYKLGDVRDLSRLKEVLEGMDFVIHAAAIKHVVMAEKNPQECHKTNVVGTQNVIQSCTKAGVRKAILISTDKAVNPIGVYGKSKQQAEYEWLNANGERDGCQFSIVRLGNIIGARGSVFEAFEKQRKTGVVKVTHPEATRYCISQKDAADFVLSAFEHTEALLVPEMDTFNVLELAKKIAPECKIEIIGLRPGDKLHEEIGDAFSNRIIESIQ